MSVEQLADVKRPMENLVTNLLPLEGPITKGALSTPSSLIHILHYAE